VRHQRERRPAAGRGISRPTQFYDLLTNNYVEDDDNTYRFDYSREFLRWALTPPGYRPEWLVGIRDENNRLVASITGVPVTALVEKDKIKMAEINFLCVHKDHRVNKLAALLISEVTRRVNLRDKWQAVIPKTFRFTLPARICPLPSPEPLTTIVLLTLRNLSTFASPHWVLSKP
jgi:glycylpeptide N-tetradecanoyltransferase